MSKCAKKTPDLQIWLIFMLDVRRFYPVLLNRYCTLYKEVLQFSLSSYQKLRKIKSVIFFSKFEQL